MNRLQPFRRLILAAGFLFATSGSLAVESSTASSPPDEVESLAQDLEESIALKEESEEEISIDAASSMDIAETRDGRRGWTFFGDIRSLGSSSDLDTREGESSQKTEISVRLRTGVSRSLTEYLRVRGRLAASCTSQSCSPDSILDDDSQGSTDHELDIDELFVHWYQSDRFDLALGRLQTKFITKGGVFAKSLDRNDSNNTRITWTDGAHGTAHHESGWESHLIVQYNPEGGPAQVLQEPLDFSSEDSRVSAFFSLTNEQPIRFLTQRALDISYYPSALKKDGLSEESRIEDYWGLVGRIAGRYPKRSSGRRLRFSAEVGYAPETPTKTGVDLSGSGDADGIAAAITISFMDLFPKQSIGLNVAHTGAGWLLSPQYNKNERLVELRYVWVTTPNLTIDARIRHRQELDQLVGAVQRRNELDAFLRLTWRFRREL